MSEKVLNTRIVHKHDIEANWLKAVNFTPKQGEIIVYDIDDAYNYERLKIGDGKTLVSALPFYAGSWNDLEDRPLVMESITITYDGSIDGYVTSDPAMLCKVSDLVLTKENVIGQSVSALVAGSMNTTIITEDEITPLEDPRSFILGGVVACIAEDNTIYSGSITFPEKGVYFYSNSGAYVTSLGVTNAAEVFDEKYIPSTIARKEDVVQSDWSEGNESSLSYVKNKTHYYCEGSTIVKETSITVTNENFTMLNSYITLEEGKKYKVVIDGVQDICTAVHVEDVAAGENCIELTPTLDGFGAVRSRLTGGICTYVCGVSLGDHVISIYEDNELKQLDEMFIPDTIARVSDIREHNANETAHDDIRVSISDLSTLVGDTSVAEQIAAANMIYVGPTQPTDPNIKVWINTAEEGTGIVPILPRVATITLNASAWAGNSEPYSQVVSINTVTTATKIDLQPTASQIVSLQNAEISLMVQNNSGMVTCYAIGNKPTVDYIMQVLLQEVSYV